MNATQKRKPSKTSKAIKQIRYVFEALFLSFILLIAKILPLKTASNFGGWIGRTIGIRLAASRKAINNLKMIYPDKTQKEIEQITIGMWDNLGRVIFEYSHLEKIARRTGKYARLLFCYSIISKQTPSIERRTTLSLIICSIKSGALKGSFPLFPNL